MSSATVDLKGVTGGIFDGVRRKGRTEIKGSEGEGGGQSASEHEACYHRSNVLSRE